MSATLTITPFEGKLVTIDSPLSYNDLTSRLEAETNKKGTAGVLLPFLASPPSKEAVIQTIAELTGGSRDFLQVLQADRLILLTLCFKIFSTRRLCMGTTIRPQCASHQCLLDWESYNRPDNDQV